MQAILANLRLFPPTVTVLTIGTGSYNRCSIRTMILRGNAQGQTSSCAHGTVSKCINYQQQIKVEEPGKEHGT